MIRLEQAFGWPAGSAAQLTVDQLRLYLREHLPIELLGAGAGLWSGDNQAAPHDDTAAFDCALNATPGGGLDAVKGLAHHG